jgi:hypothetical protein
MCRYKGDTRDVCRVRTRLPIGHRVRNSIRRIRRGLPSILQTSEHGELTATGQADAFDGCTSTVTCDSPLKRSSTA